MKIISSLVIWDPLDSGNRQPLYIIWRNLMKTTKH